MGVRLGKRRLEKVEHGEMGMRPTWTMGQVVEHFD